MTKKINKKDYCDSLGLLFNDPRKFEILNEDPTLRNLSTIQRYLNTLELRGDIIIYKCPFAENCQCYNGANL